jgi:hypothetical protein
MSKFACKKYIYSLIEKIYANSAYSNSGSQNTCKKGVKFFKNNAHMPKVKLEIQIGLQTSS